MNCDKVTHPAPESKLPLRSGFVACLGGEPVVLLAKGLAAASSSDDPRPRAVDSFRRDRKESVVAKLGRLDVVAPGPDDAFASGRLRKIIEDVLIKNRKTPQLRDRSFLKTHLCKLHVIPVSYTHLTLPTKA